MIQINTSNAPIADAARALTKLLKKYKDTDVLLLFSGGSSLAIVNYLHPEHLQSKHTFTVFDERYTFEKNESNFSILEGTTFFKHAIERNISFIDPRPLVNESLQKTAKRFDLALKHWHILHREGVVIATIGIGPDGHTAGILPMPENTETFKKLFQDEKMCAVGYTATPQKSPHTQRITTTLTYISRHIHHAIIYASGIQKKEALQKTLRKEIDIPRTPAQILQEIPDAQLFTDLSL